MAHLSHNELRVTRYFSSQSNLSEVEARVYTVILSRRYSGTKAQLLNRLEYFFPPHQKVDVENAIHHLHDMGMLISAPPDQIELAMPWEDAATAKLKMTIASDISHIINNPLDEDSLIKKVGKSNCGAEVSKREAEAVNMAHRLIRIGTFSSKTVYADLASVLRNVLEHNCAIQLKLLLFSPTLAQETEAMSRLDNDVREGIENWEHLRNLIESTTHKSPNIEIRWIEDKQWAGIHRLTLIDDKFWMMGVHRIGIDRGVESLVYEGWCDSGETNIYRAFDKYWEMAWQHAKPRRKVWAPFISLHGIRTRGQWQKELTSSIPPGLRHIPLDYGFFTFVQLVCPFSRRAAVASFRHFYEQQKKEADLVNQAPSIVAHSFGTYIVAAALETFPEVRFDRIIFCGSIVRTDYNWSKMINDNRVQNVFNECGYQDVWAWLVRCVVSDAGPSGVEGFRDHGGGHVANRFHQNWRHSTPFYVSNFKENWIPFLQGETVKPLNPDYVKTVNWHFRFTALIFTIVIFFALAMSYLWYTTR